jgi:hypothetical protein
MLDSIDSIEYLCRRPNLFQCFHTASLRPDTVASDNEETDSVQFSVTKETRMLRKLFMASFLSCLSTGTLLANDSIQLASCEAGNCSSASLCDDSKWNFGGCDDVSSCDGLSLCDPGLLGFGLIKKSEHCFNDFISPMTNPVYFEDPRQLSEVRAIFIDHKLPLGLGSAQVYALQIRARLTERLSLIATKDGFIDSSSPILQDGWGDIGAGLKYSLYRDPNAGRLLSAGVSYEAPSGSRAALQGNGDGVFDFFLSGGTRVGTQSHWLSTVGLVQAIDENAENSFWFWSNHFDYRFTGTSVYAFTEFNWFHYNNNGTAFGLPIEGGDLFNLGSPGIIGNDIVTNAYGLKIKPRSNIEAGVAFEFPLTERRGVLDNRITADLIIRY